MNKLELIEALRDQTGLTKEQAKVVVETFFAKASDALVAKGTGWNCGGYARSS